LAKTLAKIFSQRVEEKLKGLENIEVHVRSEGTFRFFTIDFIRTTKLRI
jgi:hypothetical protein